MSMSHLWRHVLVTLSYFEFFEVQGFHGGHAKGAEKVSCGEMVVQKAVFGESVSSLPP